MAEPFLLFHRCWDDYSSLYWWIIKAPILLAIFVSMSPEHSGPRAWGFTDTGTQPGVCAEPEMQLHMAGELPHLPQCHQDAGAEDLVPRHQQKLQAPVHVRATWARGSSPHPGFRGDPGHQGPFPGGAQGSYLESPRPAFMGNLFRVKAKLSGRACLTGQQDHRRSPGSRHRSPSTGG